MLVGGWFLPGGRAAAHGNLPEPTGGDPARLGPAARELRRRRPSAGQLRALRALGDYPPTEVETAAGGRLSAALRELLEPIWIRHVDWLHSEENEGVLQALADQRMRFDPAKP